MKNKVTAIVVAAGSGKRIGGSIKKQFLKINGTPVLQLTLEKFQRSTLIDEIILVVPKTDVDALLSLAKQDWGISKVVDITGGGAERQDSVRAALDRITESTAWVVIHDGVRPFVRLEEIESVINAAKKHGAAVLGVPPKETVKRISNQKIIGTIKRSELFVAQTPQVFRRELIVTAYRWAQKSQKHFTDDSSLVEECDHKVVAVAGGYHNIKITTIEDVVFAEHLLNMERANENRPRI